MNKVNVDLGLNVQGYVQGINEAKSATAAYETETRKVADAQVNLRKELVSAKKEVQNLAAGYMKLTAEEKASPFGKEMARQLQDAKKKAAEFIDLQSDLNTELKNMASDTAVFDSVSDGISGLASAASAATGVMGIFTDNTQMMTKAVTMFTTAESIATAAIKIKNLFQKQSSLMLGVARVQQSMLTAAENLDTKAKYDNAVAAGVATVAQRAFNAAAKSNPYILLASALLTVVTAFSLFSDGAEDATEDQKKLNISMADGQKASEAYASSLSSEYSKLMTSYTKLKAEWANLSNNEDRKKFINNHKSELESLGAEIHNVSDAENFFANDTDRIVQGFIARAKAAAYAAKLTELYRQQMDILDRAQNLKSDRYREGGKVAEHEFGGRLELDKNGNTYNGGKYYMDNGVVKYTREGASAAFEASREFQELSTAYEETGTQIKKAEDNLRSFIGEIDKGNVSVGEAAKRTGSHSTELKAQAHSIADLESQISILQDRAKKGLLPEDLNDPEKFKAALAIMQNQLRELKIEWGFEDPKTKLQELQEKVEAAKKKFILAVDADDEQAQAVAREEVYAAQAELDKYKLSIEIEPRLSPKEFKKQTDEINKLLSEALNPKTEKPSFSFSNLSEEMRKSAGKIQEQFERIASARQNLIDKKATTTDPLMVEELTKAIEQLDGPYNELYEKLQGLQNIDISFGSAIKHFEEAKEAAQELSSTYSTLGNIAGTVGSIFKEMGDSVAATAMTIISSTLEMVAQVIPQIMSLIAAKQAEAMASGVAGAAKMPYPASIGAIASIVGAVLATFASIYSAINNAGKYAGGGTIPGNSYSGDKLLARVNSGEMILNQHQQKNLFDLLDRGAMPNGQLQNIRVTGVIRGTDLLLVQKNTNQVMKRAGNSINF